MRISQSTNANVFLAAPLLYVRQEIINPHVPGEAPDAMWVPTTHQLWIYIPELMKWINPETAQVAHHMIDICDIWTEVIGLWRV